MKLSIITINYNNRQGLLKTIDSVLSQTWHDFEWIVIDGGSTDGSREIIESIQNHLSYWCSEPDKGVYNAMNKGIAIAKGKYLNFMNSGDVYYDERTLYNVFSQEFNDEIIFGDCEQIYDDCIRQVFYPSRINLYDLYHYNICQQAMFVQSSLLQREGFDESYYILSDWVRWINAALNGATFKHIKQFVCRYDMSGMSSVYSEKLSRDYKRIQTLYPPMVFPLITRLDEYEKNIIIYRVKTLIDNGFVSSFITRSFLKLMSLIFINKKSSTIDNFIWNIKNNRK